ncbi:MAG TPA: hypothetical protein DEP84_29460 [Chloroflexi bacterium]|nr:hypothetical protein [Chloroflexota bacterium]
MKRITVAAILAATMLLAGCSPRPPAPPATEPPTRQAVATPRPTFTLRPIPSATAAPLPSATATVPPFLPTPDYLATPPDRPPSPARTTRHKTYPVGAYEFIHDQFRVPPPLGPVPDEYVAGLPGVAPGLCPLTGEPPEEAANLTARPIDIRVDNSAQSRPQLGLGRADVVWETLAEGGITRFTATYQCRQPETVGPVRSARLIDLQLTPMLDALLVHVGAAQQVTDMIWASPFAPHDIDEWGGDAAFYRVAQAPVSWLRTYTTGQLIAKVAEAHGVRQAEHSVRGWRFSAAVPPNATGAATKLTIPYTPGTSSVVSYIYAAAGGRYLRFQGNVPHLDRATGRQLAADNVLVLFARETVTPIVEDKLGNRSLHYDLGGEGRGLLFRDGQFWEAPWRREGENVLVRIVGTNGEPIPLKPGQSWVQIVRDTMEVAWK